MTKNPFDIKHVYDFAEDGEVFIKPFETYANCLISNHGRVFDLPSGQMMVKVLNPNPRSVEDDLYVYQVDRYTKGPKYLHTDMVTKLYNKYMKQYSNRLWDASNWYEFLYQGFMCKDFVTKA